MSKSEFRFDRLYRIVDKEIDVCCECLLCVCCVVSVCVVCVVCAVNVCCVCVSVCVCVCVCEDHSSQCTVYTKSKWYAMLGWL